MHKRKNEPEVITSSTEPMEINNLENNMTSAQNTTPSIKQCLSTPIFWQFLVYFNVMTVRVKTMQGMISDRSKYIT